MSALSPIELLQLSAPEQLILRRLTKAPHQTAAEIAQAIQQPAAETESLLQRLVHQGRVVEQLEGGRRVFAARFVFKNRGVRNMPAGIQRWLETRSESLLDETPLTAQLATETKQALWQLGRRRSLMPHEVLAWQGDRPGFISLVQTGLLVKTRLQGRPAASTTSPHQHGYVRRAEWLGLHEVFSQTPTNATTTAATQTVVWQWPETAFVQFAGQYPDLALALARHFSAQLQNCEQTRQRGQGRVWVVEGEHPQAGATSFAWELAQLARPAGDGVATNATASTLFWDAVGRPNQAWGPAATHATPPADGMVLFSHPSGVDILTQLAATDYPYAVQLDMALGELRRRYDVMVVDSGHARQERLALLRGQADTLMTLTCDPAGAEQAMRRWSDLQPYARPGQKRVLTLNRAIRPAIEADPRFHLVIPEDDEGGPSWGRDAATGETNAQTRWKQSLGEVYRRLSLNHTLEIFVPSTLDVNQQVDNSAQVQLALSFLGQVFGGATSSNAEGVWRSEDSGLVTEQVTVVRTFVSQSALDAYLDQVIAFAADLKRDMKQEAVAISVDHQLILV